MTDKHRQLVAVLGLIQIEALVGSWPGGVGRPAKHRRAMACSFVAKAVYNISHTRELLDRLKSDASLRRICGWESQRELPHESQFSRAFAEFAASELPQRLHEALIKETQQERLSGCG
ncbi:MAG: transposase [Acidobacteriaceae bacterium]